MCVPAVVGALSSAGAALTGTAAAAGTAVAASNATLAIQGLSAAGKVIGAIGQANAQNQRYAQNAASAQDAYFLKTTMANRRIAQEQVQAGQQKRDADLKSMKAQSTATQPPLVQGFKVLMLVDYLLILNALKECWLVASTRNLKTWKCKMSFKSCNSAAKPYSASIAYNQPTLRKHYSTSWNLSQVSDLITLIRNHGLRTWRPNNGKTRSRKPV